MDKENEKRYKPPKRPSSSLRSGNTNIEAFKLSSDRANVYDRINMNQRRGRSGSIGSYPEKLSLGAKATTDTDSISSNSLSKHSRSSQRSSISSNSLSKHSRSSQRSYPHARNTTRKSLQPLSNTNGYEAARQNLGFDTITCTSTPHESRQRPRSTSGSRSVASNPRLNAPRKEIRSQSRQHVIRGKHVNPPPVVPNRGRSLSEHRTRQRSQSRTRATSVNNHVPRRSDGSVNSNRPIRSRSLVTGSYDGDGQRSRARSHSSHNITRHRARSRSVSRHRSVSRQRSVSSEVEPNIHHNAIITTEIECPVIAEMKENELYAKQNGVEFSSGKDELGFFDMDDEILIQDEKHKDNLVVSPKFKGREPGSFLYDEEDEIPANATFLRADGQNKGIINNNTSMLQWKRNADRICVGWGREEYETPTIARRLVDFRFAQMKRRKKFGNERPWGILGLYDHLSAVRMDVEWAETAACRRANGEPYKAWFEFVDEKNTGTNRPFFTIITLCVCTAFMFATFAINQWQIEDFSVNPMIGPSAQTLLLLGAKDSPSIVQGGEVWRLLSAMVLHAGIIHYVLNMLALWFVGKAIEQCHGFFASMLLFVAPGIGGTILSAIFLPNMISVGASGGIFGLIGACLADIFMNWGLIFNKEVNGEKSHAHVYVILVLVLDIIVNSVIGLTPFVDNFTHLGGMIFGFICGTSTMQRISTDMFEKQKEMTIWRRCKMHFVRFFGIILTFFVMVASFLILMGGDGETSPCNACKAISCVPFPPWNGPTDKWWYCDDCAVVSADARINSETNTFDQLTLNCPRGDLFTMELDAGIDSDRDWLEGQLPNWCRLHCDGI